MRWDQEAVREINYKSLDPQPKATFVRPPLLSFSRQEPYLQSLQCRHTFTSFATSSFASLSLLFFDHRLTFAGRLALCLTFSLANIGLVAHWTQATLFQDTLVDFEIVGLVAGGLSALVFPVLYVLDPKTRL